MSKKTNNGRFFGYTHMGRFQDQWKKVVLSGLEFTHECLSNQNPFELSFLGVNLLQEGIATDKTRVALQAIEVFHHMTGAFDPNPLRHWNAVPDPMTRTRMYKILVDASDDDLTAPLVQDYWNDLVRDPCNRALERAKSSNGVNLQDMKYIMDWLYVFGESHKIVTRLLVICTHPDPTVECPIVGRITPRMCREYQEINLQPFKDKWGMILQHHLIETCPTCKKKAI